MLAVPMTGIARDQSVVREFRKTHACPATQKFTGACGGYVVDHKWPLCAGGPDTVDNMQWQTRKDALAKDKVEWAVCRKLRSLGYQPSKEGDD